LRPSFPDNEASIVQRDAPLFPLVDQLFKRTTPVRRDLPGDSCRQRGTGIDPVTENLSKAAEQQQAMKQTIADSQGT
jgi:hypothetical protein